MKIAVISDVHGNKSALDKVLDDIKQKKADKIYCLGDIAMGGYDPNYTIDKLFELKKEMNDDFEIIQGNTDKLIVDYNDTLYEKMLKANPLMAQALNLDVKIGLSFSSAGSIPPLSNQGLRNALHKFFHYF